jgi:chromosome segregation ATPase
MKYGNGEGTMMDDRLNSTTSDELERQLREAEQAQAEADAAVQRAATERAEAEATQQRILEEHAARRQEWAQNVLDSYDADLAAAEAAIRENSDRFADLAVRDLAAAVKAYMAWSEASLRHYALQVRVATVAPELGLEATPGEVLNPPPFSQALDAAIELYVAEASARIRDEMAAEVEDRPERPRAQPGAA